MVSPNGRNDGTRYDAAEERIDECLYLLSDGRRREVLSTLAETDVTTVDELVASVDDRCDDEDSVDISTSLYHVHLPKLDSGELIEFDPDRGRIEKTDWPPLVSDLVRRIER